MTESQTAVVLVDRASRRLAEARTAAEILEAVTIADAAYDLAKHQARFRGAHDEVVKEAREWQADALRLISRAKVRLADEYDRAQVAGEVRGVGERNIPDQNISATHHEIGLTAKDVYEARLVRDAEANDPGIIERSLLHALEHGDEPTKAKLRAAIVDAAQRGTSDAGVAKPRSGNRNPNYKPDPAFNAASALIGRCRDVIAVIDDNGTSLILRGFFDSDDRKRAFKTIEAARNYLTRFMEEANGVVSSTHTGSAEEVRAGSVVDH